MTLDKLKVGEYAKIDSVLGEGATRQHLLDMGVINDNKIKLEKIAPMGDPIEITISGYELTLRLDDAKKINIKKITEEEYNKNEEKNCDFDLIKISHPGIGEKGKFHDKNDNKNYVKGEILTFALVGNQNSGKTTLFNQLTGSNQHVGNFPGVTIDKKEGKIIGHNDTIVTDLPGIYSMSPYSQEEIISKNFVLDEKPTCIINIVDATNIERNLYLTMQLLEMDIPVVVALNMMDEIFASGGMIDINKLESLLGIPVVPISAIKNQGVSELIEHAIHIAKFKEKPQRVDFCDEKDNGGAVHRCIHAVIHLIDDHARRENIPTRFAATKIIEGDELIINKLKLTQNEMEMLEHMIVQMEEERGLDRSAALADMRYKFIDEICNVSVKKPKVDKEHKRSEFIDKLLTGKYTAIPSFIIIMLLVFYLSFNLIGPFFQNILNNVISNLSNCINEFLIVKEVNVVMRNLIIHGIFAGVGSVVSFLPIIVILFFFLSLLEDTGYIARVAFFMDKILRKIGLSGRSMVPLLIGFGCSVPAIMATRTLPSERDRKMTILLTPFMSCSAKLPIYAFFVNAFFEKYAALIMASIYFLGILIGILISFLYRKTISKGEAVPFVMELPNYRLPSLKNIIILLWEKAKDFLWKAFSIILIATIIVWFLQTFDIRFNVVKNSEESIMAILSGFLVPLFRPIGLGDWRICTSLITGFMAKESVVSTMKVLFGGATIIKQVLSKASIVSLIVFSLLYTPCIAAVTAIKRELSLKWAIFVVIFQCLLAYVVSYIFYNIMLL